ncbi:hypothetical protein CEXT_684181 [Caerostris extrusa]|uniref:Secreted protein n=1 Tax=Caerostris extrusa TaxID=172846 RepID=A0AAV4T3U3_CAEEX|nr:hypothetical protein CEXT_684181 [Caerostris extrusa]
MIPILNVKHFPMLLLTIGSSLLVKKDETKGVAPPASGISSFQKKRKKKNFFFFFFKIETFVGWEVMHISHPLPGYYSPIIVRKSVRTRSRDSERDDYCYLSGRFDLPVASRFIMPHCCPPFGCVFIDLWQRSYPFFQQL